MSGRVVVLDYGAGNTGSVAKAIAWLGAPCEVSAEPAALRAAAGIVLPGVGHFGAMMEELERRGLRAALAAYLRSGRPFLGICAGMQALFAGSDEAPGVPGLGWFPEVARRFPDSLTTPLVGWARLRRLRPSRLLAGLDAAGVAQHFYFTHSYCLPPTPAATAAAEYGAPFAAMLESGNVCATQFHPEKSGEAGLRLLANFLRIGGGENAPAGEDGAAAAVASPGAGIAKRVIACLDMKNGRVVKGVQFQKLRDQGDPAALALAHADSGADEILLLDIGATPERRPLLLEAVRRTAAGLFVPLGAGGGVRGLADAAALLEAGADKVTVNTAAAQRPELIGELAGRLGSQAVVVAVDARRIAAGGWEVMLEGGRRAAGRDAVAWAAEAAARGAGEILLTSVDADGGQSGFDGELTAAVARAVRVPVIASGGAGAPQDFVRVLRSGADAALAASIFHSGAVPIRVVKRALAAAGMEVRP